MIPVGLRSMKIFDLGLYFENKPMLLKFFFAGLCEIIDNVTKKIYNLLTFAAVCVDVTSSEEQLASFRDSISCSTNILLNTVSKSNTVMLPLSIRQANVLPFAAQLIYGSHIKFNNLWFNFYALYAYSVDAKI